jgi:hypothetical protein
MAQLDFMPLFVIPPFGRGGKIPSPRCMANLAEKLNRFIDSNYFNKPKELLMRSDIVDKPQRICGVDDKDAG